MTRSLELLDWHLRPRREEEHVPILVSHGDAVVTELEERVRVLELGNGCRERESMSSRRETCSAEGAVCRSLRKAVERERRG